MFSIPLNQPLRVNEGCPVYSCTTDKSLHAEQGAVWPPTRGQVCCLRNSQFRRAKCENTQDYCRGRGLNGIFTVNTWCNPLSSSPFFPPMLSPLCSPSLPLLPPFPDLSPQSRVTLSAHRQEDELGNLQQPGAGRRPTAPAAVPPEGNAAARSGWGGAASGLQAGGDGQGSARRLPGFTTGLRHGGSEDHASQRPGDQKIGSISIQWPMTSC